MIDRLAAAVSAIDADLTAQEWSDALWLAQFLPHRPAGDVDPAESRGPPDGGPTGQVEGQGSSAATTTSASPTTVPSREDEGATLHLPAPASLAHAMAVGPPTDIPALATLPRTLPLLRSMRALRKRRPSHRHLVIDERATAERVADSGVWSPVLRPQPVRRFDLALVADTSESMVLWRRTVAELRDVFEHLGAFRDVRVWRLDADEPGIPLRQAGSGDRAISSPRDMAGPGAGRVVVVVSDCVGAGWRDGAVQRQLEAWAQATPVAVLHVLPQSMWRRCATEFRAVRLGARTIAAPNSELVVSVSDGRSRDSLRGHPIPVLQLDPRWLEPWSGLIAGTLSTIDAIALFTSGPIRAQLPRRHDGDGPPDATRLVYRFRNVASPEAFQLAAYLAATPLTLPVMRLIQGALMPNSRPAHLAEFFLSDLIYRVNADSSDPDEDPDRIHYEFHAGVRDLLLTRLRRVDIMHILHRVADHIGLASGAPRSFRAILAAGEAPGSASVTAPFARVLRHVLPLLGGPYAGLVRESGGHSIIESNIEIRGDIGDIEIETSPETRRRRASMDSTRGDAVTTPPTAAADRTPVIFEGVPTRNPNFTGREELLHQLNDRLESSRTALLPQALHGLGGVGKTQLAVEFCHRFAGNYDVICWIPAEQPGLARSALAGLGPRLGLPGADDQGSAVSSVLQALRRGQPYDRWLLVFDNADQPQDLDPLMPEIQGPGGHILITSRNTQWATLAKVIEVDVFTREESIDLLERRGPSISREEANLLAEKLGDLPLALEHAAAWRAETGMPVSVYLRLFDERLEQLLAETPPSNYPTSVAATWRIAFERLLEESPAALELLQLFAFFGAEPISLQLMPIGRFAPSMSEDLRRTVADPIELGRAIRNLGRYALARVDHAGNSVQVHRLVQAVLRERLTDEQTAEYRRTVQEILAAANPGDPDGQETWERHSKLAPHVITSGAVDGATEDIRRLILDQIRYHAVRGDFDSSRQLGELAYNRWRDDPRLGADHEQTLVGGRLLAIALRWLGHGDRAREINEDTLHRQEARWDSNHEHSLVTASSLGADLRAAGRFEEARELDERTYRGHLRTFGEDHLNTLQAANNLAVDRRFAGRFLDALDLDRDTLERRRRVRGENHPDTLLSYMNIGRDYHGIGRYNDARDALKRAIDGYERSFGPDHLPLLLTYRLYSAVLRKLGQYELAHNMAVINVERYQRRLDENHPDILVAMMNLCSCIRAIRQTAHAAEMGRELLTKHSEVFGDAHAFTLAMAANFANMLRDVGEYREARQIDERTLVAMNTLFAKEHPSSLSVGNNLANDLYHAGDHEGALRLSQTTMERSRQVRGFDDPYTLGTCVNHAIDLRTAGEEDAARALESDTWWRYARVLGERHPETLLAMTGVRLDAEIDPPPT